jgi:intracellular multiplication protein IcmK
MSGNGAFAVEEPAPLPQPQATEQVEKTKNTGSPATQQQPKKKKRVDLSSPATRDKIIEQQFSYQLDMMLPLDTTHINQHKKQIQATEKAIRPDQQPNIVTGSRQLILEPNAPIPKIFLTPGFVTALVFYDATGAPWPITSCTEGNPNYFSVVRPEGLKPGNMITVQSISQHASSNIVLTLAEFSLPVVLQIVTTDMVETPDGRVNTDSMVSFRATKKGPLAKQPIVGRVLESAVSEQIMSFLDGIPPKGAEYIDSVSVHSGMDMWRYKGLLYLRTQYPVIWPAWDLVVNGSEGITLYRLPDVPSIMVSDNGNNLSLDVN